MSGLDERPAEIAAKEQKREKSEKRQRSIFKGIMKIVIWVCVIALLIFLTLFLSSRIAEFDSIGDMIRYIRSQFS